MENHNNYLASKRREFYDEQAAFIARQRPRFEPPKEDQK
jgi:hypothetical protein